MLYNSNCLRIKLSRYIPIKQGLRHIPSLHYRLFGRVTIHSNKTRIKTVCPCFLVLGLGWSRYIPIKQGLRQSPTQCLHFRLLSRYIPIKQGLRHFTCRLAADDAPVSRYIPIKQGFFFNAECRIMNAELRMRKDEFWMLWHRVTRKSSAERLFFVVCIKLFE